MAQSGSSGNLQCLMVVNGYLKRVFLDCGVVSLLECVLVLGCMSEF